MRSIFSALTNSKSFADSLASEAFQFDCPDAVNKRKAEKTPAHDNLKGRNDRSRRAAYAGFFGTVFACVAAAAAVVGSDLPLALGGF